MEETARRGWEMGFQWVSSPFPVSGHPPQRDIRGSLSGSHRQQLSKALKRAVSAACGASAWVRGPRWTKPPVPRRLNRRGKRSQEEPAGPEAERRGWGRRLLLRSSPAHPRKLARTVAGRPDSWATQCASGRRQRAGAIALILVSSLGCCYCDVTVSLVFGHRRRGYRP